MSERSRAAAVLVVTLVSSACAKDKPVPTAEPSPSASTRVAPSPSAEPGPPPDVPRFELAHRFERRARFFAVGTAAIVCSGECTHPTKGGPKPKVWLMQGDRVEERPELWPGNAYANVIGAMQEEGGVSFRYFGTYPDDLFVFPDYSVSRGGINVGTAKFHKKYWVLKDGGDRYGASPKPPRRYDDAVLSSPVEQSPQSGFVYGAGGPTLYVRDGKLHTYDGKKWSTRKTPWGPSPKATRLTTGATLVTSESRAYLVRKDGSLHNLTGDVQGKSTGAWLQAAAVDGKLWVAATTSSDLSVMRAKNAGSVTVAGLEKREPPRPRSKNKPTAAPTAPSAPGDAAATTPTAGDSDAAAKPDATAKVGDDALPAPSPFSAECRTPFVMMATPPSKGWNYTATAKGLRGFTKLVGRVTFIELVREGRVYFGAQATDEASANDLIAALKQGIPKMKPRLVCFDGLKHLPDRYAPPDNIRVVFIHLASGTTMKLL